MKQLILVLLLWPLVALAADKDSEAMILQKLAEARPDLSYGKVEPTPVAGVYQVQVTNGPLLYVSEDGEHMFVGELYQIMPGQFVNLAEVERTAMRRERLASLDKNDLIIFPAEGETKAIINVFTDVDCGYCRKLHKEVPELNKNGVEVRYLAFPRAGIKSKSAERIAIAWCADNPQQALTDLKAGKDVEGEVCADNPVAAEYQLGIDFGVNGTPALVLMDGTLIPGYRPADELLSLLGVN